MDRNYAQAGNAAPMHTTISSVTSDFDLELGRLNELLKAAETISDKLHGGHAREPEKPPGPQPVPSGAIGEIRLRRENLGAAINRLASELERIAGAI